MSGSTPLQIQFLGIDEGADPKNLPPGTLLRAENVRMSKPRRLETRMGTTGLLKTRSDAGSIAAGKRLVAYPQGDVGLYDGQDVFNRNDSAASWVPVDRVSPWTVTRRALADASRSVSYVDTVISGSLLFSVYQTGATGSGAGAVPPRLYLQVENLATGQAVGLPKLIPVTADYTSPRIVLGASAAYVLWAIQGGVCIRSVSLTTFAMSATTTLFADAVVAPLTFDAVIGTSSSGEVVYVGYELAAGANRVQVRSFLTASFAADQAATAVGGNGLEAICLAWCPLASRVGVIFSTSSLALVNATMLDRDLVTITAMTAVSGAGTNTDNVFIAEDSATHVILGYQASDAASLFPKLFTAKSDIATLGIPAATTRLTQHIYRPSKPWKTGSRWYVAATVHIRGTGSQVAPQESVVVVELQFTVGLSSTSDFPHVQVATLENQTGWYPLAGTQTKASVDASGNVWIPASYRGREARTQDDDEFPVGWNICTVALNGLDHGRCAQLGAGILTAGGSPLWLDGASATPYGFAHTPRIISVTAVNGGGLLAGTYSYVACYVWVDASGLTHRSTPSPPMTGITATTNLTLSIVVASASLSSKQQNGRVGNDVANPVMVELYRTVITGTGSHYRLIETTAINDPLSRSITITDALPDSDISSVAVVPLTTQAQLYTELGELANVPPPAFTTVATHRGRLVGIGPDLRTLWFSKDFTNDQTLAPGFNEALTLPFASDKTALASQDAVLVVFGEDTIDVVHNDGPDDRGDANNWSIQSVQTDVGCVNPRSPVTTPMGTIFESRRGLELLDRSLTVAPWFGKGAVDTLALYPTITSAVLVAEQHEIRFTCDNGSSGIVLAYDYHEKIWFTRKYTDASDTAAASVRFVDAALIDGVYTLLTAAGQVYRESTATSLDGGTAYVSTDIVLAPIHAQPGRSGWSNDNLGWSRAKDLTLMGTSVAPHDLQISFAMNYASSYGQTHTFLADAAGTPTAPGPLEKARVTLATQKCQSVQIRIRNLTPTGHVITDASAGPILESLCLRVAAKEGPAKTTAGQQG